MDPRNFRSLLEQVNRQGEDLLKELEQLREHNASLTEMLEAREEAMTELQQTHEVSRIRRRLPRRCTSLAVVAAKAVRYTYLPQLTLAVP